MPWSFYDSDQPAGVAAVAPSYIELPMAAGAMLTLTASNLLPTHTVCAFGGDGSDGAPPDADPTVATVSSVASARCAAPRAASPLLTTVRLEQPRADGAVAATAALPLSIFEAPALDAGTAHAAAVGDAARRSR